MSTLEWHTFQQSFDDVGYLVRWFGSPMSAFLVATNSKYYKSTDGITWDSIPHPFIFSGFNEIFDFAYSPELDIAVTAGVGYTDDGLTYLPAVYSTDRGLTWINIATDTIGSYGTAVDWSSDLGLFVLRVVIESAFGTAPANVSYYSSDGINWTAGSDPLFDYAAPVGLTPMNASKTAAMRWISELGLFVNIGDQSRSGPFIPGTSDARHISVSSDGINWTGKTSPFDTWSLTGPLGVTGVSGAAIRWVPDASQLFIGVTLINFGDPTGLTPVLVSSDGSSYSCLSTYPNYGPTGNINESPVYAITVDSSLGRILTAVDYNYSLDVFTLLNSDDAGSTWNEEAILSNYEVVDIDYSPDLDIIVAVGSGYDDVHMVGIPILSSPDDVDWTVRQYGLDFG